MKERKNATKDAAELRNLEENLSDWTRPSPWRKKSQHSTLVVNSFYPGNTRSLPKKHFRLAKPVIPHTKIAKFPGFFFRFSSSHATPKNMNSRERTLESQDDFHHLAKLGKEQPLRYMSHYATYQGQLNRFR